MKAWIGNHHICSKCSWNLLIYDFPESVAKEWQVILERYFRKWIGLNATVESSILYRNTNHFGLNFKDLGKSLRELQVVRWHIMKYAKDNISRKLYHYRQTQDKLGHTGKGRKFVPSFELESYEGRLATKTIVGNAQIGTSGLGFHKSRWQKSTVNLKDKRKQIVKMMKDDAEDKRLVELGKYEIQAKWLAVGIDNMQRKDLTWNKLLYQCSDRLVKFLVNAIPNWLPSPDNLRRWNQKGDHKCGLCGARFVTLAHILCGCPWVREVENKSGKEDRYTWRHNCILELLATAIQNKVKYVNALPLKIPRTKFIHFVAEGKKSNHTKLPPLKEEESLGLLSAARDWFVDFDLPSFRTSDSKYIFPYDVCATPQKIDGYIISRKEKICIAGPELTAPMEENIQKWNKIKKDKYASLEPDSKEWKMHTLVLEVGTRGWIPPSFGHCLRRLGFSSQETKHLANECSLMSQRCTYIIWLHRNSHHFSPRRLTSTVSNDFKTPRTATATAATTTITTTTTTTTSINYLTN
jgi:hypothetical protein